MRTRADEDAPPPPPRPRRGACRFGGQAPLLLKLSHVDLYVEYRPVLKDLNWQLRRGEHWSIFGANGAGKSSFLKLIYGDLAPALGGRIERSRIPPGTPISEWKRHVGYVSPELQSLYAVDVSILDLVASGRHSSIGLIDAADCERIGRWRGTGSNFSNSATCMRRRPLRAVLWAVAPRADCTRNGGGCAHSAAG